MGRILLLLVALGGLAFALAATAGPGLEPLPVPWRPATEPVTAGENVRLWGEANSALSRFIAAGLRSGDDGIVGIGRPERKDEATRAASEFASAVDGLRRAAPPGEQASLHEALVPVYVDIRDQMTRVLDAASSGDALRADLEWQKLALLVEEAGATSRMLSRVDTWVVVANTDGQGVYVRKTPRMDDKLTAWPEGTRLRRVGAEVEGEGRLWVQVADPAGQVGWVPEDYVVINGGQ